LVIFPMLCTFIILKYLQLIFSTKHVDTLRWDNSLKCGNIFWSQKVHAGIWNMSFSPHFLHYVLFLNWISQTDLLCLC
jgi:hypothetical protein